MKPLLLCLGNEIVSDDRFAFEVAVRLQVKNELMNRVDIEAVSVAGFALLDLMNHRSRVLIVDTIQTGEVDPGTLSMFTDNHFIPSSHLTNSHQLSLPTSIEFGRELGYEIPKQIDILVVEAEDVFTLSEQLTPAVEQAIPQAIAYIEQWLQSEVTA